MNDFDWIEDISTDTSMIIIEFPSNKYNLDDVSDFIFYLKENYPNVEPIMVMDPDVNDGGVKYFIEPMGPRRSELTGYEYDSSWSDYTWEGSDLTKIEEYVIMEWDEFRESKIQLI